MPQNRKMEMNRSALSSIVFAHRTGRYAFDTQPTVRKRRQGQIDFYRETRESRESKKERRVFFCFLPGGGLNIVLALSNEMEQHNQ